MHKSEISLLEQILEIVRGLVEELPVTVDDGWGDSRSNTARANMKRKLETLEQRLDTLKKRR